MRPHPGDPATMRATRSEALRWHWYSSSGNMRSHEVEAADPLAIIMKVTVTIDLTVSALKKHRRQMRMAASLLTDAKKSVRVSQPAGKPKRLKVSFSVPKARQADVVDHIARQFWYWIEDYGDISVGFEPELRRTRRSRKS
jgi:hypothetical protein